MLTGNGTAAAVIAQAGSKRQVTGTADVNVRMGASIAPTWDGVFQMLNASGDSLNFEAAGNIQSDGRLAGNQTAYRLVAGGATFERHTVTSEQINGSLLGAPGATRPSGVVGSFQFIHGSQATVNGGFGADFPPTVP